MSSLSARVRPSIFCCRCRYSSIALGRCGQRSCRSAAAHSSREPPEALQAAHAASQSSSALSTPRLSSLKPARTRVESPVGLARRRCSCRQVPIYGRCCQAWLQLSTAASCHRCRRHSPACLCRRCTGKTPARSPLALLYPFEHLGKRLMSESVEMIANPTCPIRNNTVSGKAFATYSPSLRRPGACCACTRSRPS